VVSKGYEKLVKVTH